MLRVKIMYVIRPNIMKTLKTDSFADCRTGFYGPSCNMSCENCINGCNSVSGECTTAGKSAPLM